MRLRIVFVVALVVSVFGLVRAGVQIFDSDARTYYEGLNLESPEAAVQTFVDAFQRRDFMTVYFVLSPKAQTRWLQLIRLFDSDELIRLDEDDDPRTVLADVPVLGTGLDFDVLEHSPSEGFYLFDGLMLEAARQDRLLIDLRGEVVISESRMVNMLTDNQLDLVMDVPATVEGIEGEVIFRVNQAPSGRWRVHQVIVPGGDESKFPWSVADS